MVRFEEHSAWDLFRRGQVDQRKHLKILERMIKENAHDLIVHGKVIAGDNVVLPVKHLKQWRFVYEEDKDEGTIAHPNADEIEEGDVIGEKKKAGGSQGNREGGSEKGDSGYYEVVVNADYIAEYLFRDMKLPRLKRKQPKNAFKQQWKMDSISQKGSMKNLQKKKTVYENIKRNAARGEAIFKDPVDDDLRFRSSTVKKIPEDKIVAVFLRDRSASMNDHKKEMTRIMSFWFNKFLEYKYSQVIEKIFILFDTDANETDEEEFYSLSEGGGTIISSGFELTDKILNKRYPPSSYNVYVFGFTDGDNMATDNNKAVNTIVKLSFSANLVGIGHIKGGDMIPGSKTADSHFIQRLKSIANINENLEVSDVLEKQDIIATMQIFFGGGGDNQ